MLGKRVKALRESKDWSQGELARRIGGTVKQQNIQQLEDGLVRQPRYLHKLIEVLGTSYDELMNKPVRPFNPPSIGQNDKILDIKPVILYDSLDELPRGDFVLVQKIDVSASAGEGFVNGDYPEEERPIAFRADWIKNSKAKSTNLRIITVKGESMLPTLFDGDDTLVDLEQSEIVNGLVYAFYHDGSIKIKRLYRKGDRIVSHSDNDQDPRYKYDQEYSSDDDLKVIGRIVNRSGSGNL